MSYSFKGRVRYSETGELLSYANSIWTPSIM
jgi:hypothetical protein